MRTTIAELLGAMIRQIGVRKLLSKFADLLDGVPYMLWDAKHNRNLSDARRKRIVDFLRKEART